MPSESVLSVLQRHDPAAYSASIPYRSKQDLPFDPTAAPHLPLLLDATVYIDRLHGKLPIAILALIASRPVFHSAVAISELSISVGILDPNHPETSRATTAIFHALSTIDMSSVLAPSATAWTEAGMLAGILARTQGLAVPKKSLSNAEECCQRGRRRELINDALIYLSAIESGSLLISRNSKHMDLLSRLKPAANILLYDV